MTSLEDVARTIGEKSTQNGFSTTWTWAGDDLELSMTGQGGKLGPKVTLGRDARRQTVATIDGKRFGTWPANPEHVPWGRFWRAVRTAASPRRVAPYSHRAR